MKGFMEQVSKRTNGGITWREYYAGALGGAYDVLYLGAKGTADVVVYFPGYYPGIFRLSRVGELPYTGEKMDARIKAYLDLTEELPQIRNEFAETNLKMIAPLFSNLPALAMSEKRIDKLADFKGVKIGSVGHTLQLLEQWEAVPVEVSYGEVYESTATGVVEGTWGTPLSSIVIIGVHELSKYFIDVGTGPAAAGYAAINLDTYNKLPSEWQQIIDEESAAIIPTYTELRMDGIRRGIKTVVEAGGTEIYALPDALKAELKEIAAQAVFDTWVGEMTDAGIAKSVAERALSRYMELYEQYASDATFKGFPEIYETEFK